MGFYIQILAGTLGFAGHLVSPTVSEANVEGRPTISNSKAGLAKGLVRISAIISIVGIYLSLISLVLI